MQEILFVSKLLLHVFHLTPNHLKLCVASSVCMCMHMHMCAYIHVSILHRALAGYNNVAHLTPSCVSPVPYAIMHMYVCVHVSVLHRALAS